MFEPWQALAIGVFVAVLVFLVLREFVCWYFKINERIANQREIIGLLKLMAGARHPDTARSEEQQIAEDTGGW